jgi:hypothetical protein
LYTATNSSSGSFPFTSCKTATLVTGYFPSPNLSLTLERKKKQHWSYGKN